ncbi:MAG: GTP cyclohydrolase I FolE [Rhodobacteraceae bacterium]|nr:GTP cyclohydrolase I FolE [Paracoccaceae bacterium]|tara:strand:- start:1 stop:618 length:618 start_codon:yes stop_codon:yes gene_type:complete
MGVHDFSIKSHSVDGRGPEKPSEQEALRAVITMLRWAGDDPNREGLVETPKRVLKAFNEWFSGYNENPVEILEKTFREVEGYEDWVVLKSIRLESYCEHHLAPIIGTVRVAYLPDKLVVGISKLARVVDIFAKRLQIQERLTREIGLTIEDVLKPKGVAVLIEAEHHCMCTRGVHKPGTSMVTTTFLGEAKTDVDFRRSFLDLSC